MLFIQYNAVLAEMFYSYPGNGGPGRK